MAATIEHQLPPHATFSIRQVLWWTLAAVHPRIARPHAQFVAMGRRGRATNGELNLRRRLLAEAQAGDEHAASFATRREHGG